MRAAFYQGPRRPISIECVAMPEPGADELLVEIARCGICGSDVSMTSGGPFDYATGRCFGHEYAGTIVDLGKEVTGFKRGERIACLPLGACGQCENCREGRLLFCLNGRPSGGGFAEFAVIAASAALRLPQSLSFADGAMIEPMACGLRALKMAGMQKGDRVLVLGAGSMAMSIVWWARLLGAGKIVVASRSAHRRDICLAMGADAVHRFAEDDPAALEKALGGAPHIVAECAGKEGMINLALDHVRLGGTVISIGMCQQAEPILPARLSFREARIVFPLAYSQQEFEQTAREFDARGFKPEIMISDVLPLEQLDAAMNDIRAGGKKLKIHIDPRIKS